MGEWSKSIGEKGEKIVKFLFEDTLEFNSLIENETINCNYPKEHKRKEAKKDRTTHGIDGLIYYKSPVEDELLDICLISSKYTSEEYPNSPKAKFKSYVEDLAHTLQCFNNSQKKNEINHKFTDVTKTHVTGILVWLSDESDIGFDLNSKVNNSLFSSDLIFDEIILIDNQRINFLYESIYKTKLLNKDSKVDFVYHNSGINFNARQEKTYGNVFPLNYIYSDIIPLRIEDKSKNKVTFSIFVNDDFNNDNLARILSFTKSFDYLNAIDETIINFKTYNSLTDISIIKDVLSTYDNYKLEDNLFIGKFPIDYRN
ncbi:hypothetical protein [Tenacibaculum singaporense]|uniref:GAPS4 PD-(D/E)XK nuclease domain-containing protein n=1 Tax=Tenacibaculum singaporense TaxID=2358479 RepID=A0A3S8RAW3_9FLAO|nr:hypothetical protein [Tenacibaculum singaporense]AZJ36875.1 hypothetical protein D6T69_15550 [Tenacibaculum singaporense]